jgi:hypothetical protein
MIRFTVRAMGVWLFAAAVHAADLAPDIGLEQLPVLAHALQDSLVDLDHAVVGTPDPCTRNVAFVDSLKAQILLQVFGNFTLERVASDVQGATPPPYPTPFNDAQKDVGLKDLLRTPEPMARLGEVVAAYGTVLARHRAIALAGIDDLLRFEPLEVLLTPDERESLLQAYWKEPLDEFHANAEVRRTLGVAVACYRDVIYVENIMIAGRRTFANLSPLANYYLMFWMRRRVEGNAGLVREALETIRASLLTASPTPR